MFVWTVGFQNPLVHTDFNMFVDELTSVNEIPVIMCVMYIPCCKRTVMHFNPFEKRTTIYGIIPV